MMIAFDEFTKQELESWIEHCNKFFNFAKVPTNDVGGVLSVYGRLIEYATMKNNEIAELNGRIDELEAALRKIASGDGVYGQQAVEYKQIAKDALGDE
jgi:hypothetical protein